MEQPNETPLTAYDIKDLHQSLNFLTDDVLKQIPVLPPGSPILIGAHYCNLSEPFSGQYEAPANGVVGPNEYYAAKHDLDYELWNLLTGVDNPDRLNRFAPEGSQG